MLRFVNRIEPTGGAEAERGVAGDLGAVVEIVVAPPAADEAVLFEFGHLNRDGGFELRLPLRIARRAAMERHQPLGAEGVAPDVVQGVGRGAAHMFAFGQHPRFPTVDRRGDFRAALAFELMLDRRERLEREARHREPKTVVGAGNRGVDVEPLGLLGAPPTPLGPLIGQQKIDAALDGRLHFGGGGRSDFFRNGALRGEG